MFYKENDESLNDTVSFVREVEATYCGIKKVRWPNKKIVLSDPFSQLFFKRDYFIDKVEKQDIVLFANHFLNLENDLELSLTNRCKNIRDVGEFSINGSTTTMEIGAGNPLVLNMRELDINFRFIADKRVKTLLFPTIIKEREMGFQLQKATWTTQDDMLNVTRSVRQRMNFQEETYYEMNYTARPELEDGLSGVSIKFQLERYPEIVMENYIHSFFNETSLSELTVENLLQYIASSKNLFEQPRFSINSSGVFGGECIEFQSGKLVNKQLYEKSSDPTKQVVLKYSK